MATDDLSRSAFYPEKRYEGVRLQQGRVLTDDDFNEQDNISRNETHLMRNDVIGVSGSPDQGFSINAATTLPDIDFEIHAGVMYLGGLRIELTEKQDFKLQSDWLQKPITPAPAAQRIDMVYLEAWQQSVSAIEDSELFEKALGGPDTTTRRRTMFRVKLATDVDSAHCPQAWTQVKTAIENELGGEFIGNHRLNSDATLTVGYEDNGVSDDLCSSAAIAGYLGAENQAIRVQLVDEAHFTWGFDNAAPLYRVTLEDAASDRQRIKLLTQPKDQAHWPKAGQIVEIIPWSAVLENGEKLAEEIEPGHFSSLSASYNPDTDEITLTDPLPDPFGDNWESRDDVASLRTTHFGTEDLDDEHGYFFMRVWDRGADLTSDPVIPIVNPNVLGTSGINITIEGDHRIAADHWIIAARPHTPDQVVPWQLETGRHSEGYQRFYTPLAIIHWHAEGMGGHTIYDCRKTFRPLTDLDGCCTFTVGDGVKTKGDFCSIDEAIKHLPVTGGRICVLPGIHRANIHVSNRNNIHITGCKNQTIIHPTLETPDAPIFAFSSCQNIRIDDVSLITHTGTAIEVLDGDGDMSTGISIERNTLFALVHAINIRVNNDQAGKNNVRIRDNTIGMWDLEDSDVAIFSEADDVLIENNKVIIIPDDIEQADDEDDGETPGGGVYDPCTDPDAYYGDSVQVYLLFVVVLVYVQQAWPHQQQGHTYKAKGGIQIGGGSEEVRVKSNQITGGFGNGITLGHLPDTGDLGNYLKNKLYVEHLEQGYQDQFEQEFKAYLYDVVIENNTINNMGLSGIGVAAFLHLEKVGVFINIEQITIRENRITECARQVPDVIPEGMLKQGGFAGITLAACEEVTISQNTIIDNGTYENDPVCGVLIIYGEKIDISDNRILNNGPTKTGEEQSLRKGLRGGIVIKMSFKEFLYELIYDKQLKRDDAIPAVKIHDNIITQPIGQALLIFAMGPVSVASNQLASQGVDRQANPFSLFAGSVFILNLGVSQDLMMAMFLSSFKYMAAMNPMFLMNNTMPGMSEVAAAPLVGMRFGLGVKLLTLPSGQVLFADNQVTLDLLDTENSFAFSSQVIATLDDIGYNSNQVSCRTFGDALLTDVALFGVTIRSNNNRFQEGFTMTLSSLFSFGLMNTAMLNQATHCIFAFGAPAYTINTGNSVLLPLGCRELQGITTKLMAVPTNDI